MSIKDRYFVSSIDSYLCKEWLLNKHYAHRMCSISFSFGLFDMNKIMKGVLTIGKPASNQLCIGVCGIEYSGMVYELNRLCVNDGLEKNVLSYFVSRSLALIKDKIILVSYADTEMGHHGYIYQATNWVYTGVTKERTDIWVEEGRHSRHYDKNIDYSIRKHRSAKHRYVYFLNCKELFQKLNYSILPYPKGDNKRYDASYKPTIQSSLF